MSIANLSPRRQEIFAHISSLVELRKAQRNTELGNDFTKQLREQFHKKFNTEIGSRISEATVACSVLLHAQPVDKIDPSDSIPDNLGWKESFKKWYSDPDFKVKLKAFGIKIATNAGLAFVMSALMAMLNYTFQMGIPILTEKGISFMGRMGKFAAGLFGVGMMCGLEAATLTTIVSAIIELATPYLSGLSSAAFHAVTCGFSSLAFTAWNIVKSLYSFWKQGDYKRQAAKFGESVVINLTLGAFNFLLSWTASMWFPLVGVFISIAVGITTPLILSYLETLRDAEDSTLLMSIWRSFRKIDTSVADNFPDLCCTIGQSPMITPALLNGFYYEHDNIVKWVSAHKTCPMTRAIVTENDIKIDHTMKNALHRFYTCN